MPQTPAEAVSQARKLCRTLASAPLPQARAKDLFQILARARGWSPAQQDQILAFGQWLDTRPAPGAIKAQCDRLLEAL
ncbi:hypothetical protein [Caulobacter sp. RHG1]|uniref:hypothetical protein n=1 Tax=Caulobacter sp. (strain RHG1) TaxID=2545762 RepID=UPI001552BC51|nr:hypothetical protein [Caulobacter sp. RHG1]NQE61396.1 hypothetical protein [Caulobacter sp. RHG1]